MDKLESMESQVKDLNLDEPKAFRSWFADFDAELWDRQFESGVKARNFLDWRIGP